MSMATEYHTRLWLKGKTVADINTRLQDLDKSDAYWDRCGGSGMDGCARALHMNATERRILKAALLEG